jgi:hypothetical protein
MSQRLGMADGRCFTFSGSSRLVNNYVMQQNGIPMEDNYSYRQLLQQRGPSLVNELQEQAQGAGPCTNCNSPVLGQQLRKMY